MQSKCHADLLKPNDFRYLKEKFVLEYCAVLRLRSATEMSIFWYIVGTLSVVEMHSTTEYTCGTLSVVEMHSTTECTLWDIERSRNVETPNGISCKIEFHQDSFLPSRDNEKTLQNLHPVQKKIGL